MPLDDCPRVSLLEFTEERSETRLLFGGTVVYALKDSLLRDDPTDVSNVDAHRVKPFDPIRYLIFGEKIMDSPICRDNIVVAWILEASSLKYS